MRRSISMALTLAILGAPLVASASANEAIRSFFGTLTRAVELLTVSSVGQTAAVGDAAEDLPPSVTLTTTTATPGPAVPKRITATFSELITGFEIGDVAVVGGNAGSLYMASNTVYTFEVTPNNDYNTVTVSIPANVLKDVSGKGNNTSNTLTFAHDAIIPETILTFPSTTTSATFPKEVTVTFTEGVSGFEAKDVFVTGGFVSGFHASSGTVYLVKITPTAPTGTVSVFIPAFAAQDPAGNGNKASAPLSLSHNGKWAAAPAVSAAGASTASTSPWTVVCSYTPSGQKARVLSATTTDACKSACVATRGTSKGTCTFRQDLKVE